MELYQLKAFIAVARTGNLTRASELLNVSQPALSGQIKALESELGLELFERTARGMEITPAGRRLLESAEELDRRAAGLLSLARDLAGRAAGALKIGLNTDAVVLRIPALASALSASSPGVTVELVQGVSSSVADGVSAGVLDGGFVYGDRFGEGLAVLELDRSRLVVAAPVASRRRLARAPMERLLDEPWIWPPADCPFYRPTMALFRRRRETPSRTVVADQEATILGLVESGVGLSLLPRDLVRPPGRETGAFALRETEHEIALSFVSRRESWGDPLMRRLRDSLRAVWALGEEPEAAVRAP